MALKAIGLALAVLAVAPGCAALKQTGIGARLTAMAAGGSGKRAADIPRAKIEAVGEPVMRVSLPALDGDALIGIGDTKPQAVAWVSADGNAYTFRNNVLVETRGLGADLMSASAPSAGKIAAGGSHNRSYFVAGAEDRNVRYDFACQVESRGAADVVIYGLRHATRHMVERCSGASGEITNEYWFQGGMIRKSREWIGPRFGYLEFERVVD